LVYEHQTYKEMGKGLPKVGRKVQTPFGVGRVLDLDILRQRARVLFEDGATQTFAAEELRSAANPGGDAHSGPEPAEAADSFEAEKGDAPVAALALSDDLS
jgi:hypothetical protein